MIKDFKKPDGTRNRIRQASDQLDTIRAKQLQRELFGTYVASSDDAPKKKAHKESE